MASVDKPRYGVKVKYVNGAVATFWRRNEFERDRLHTELNRDPKVKTAKRVGR